MLYDAKNPQEHLAKAAEYSQRARETKIPESRDLLLRMEQTSLLMARNAEWLKSTDAYLREKRGR